MQKNMKMIVHKNNDCHHFYHLNSKYLIVEFYTNTEECIGIALR
jgi:hypothetical protein